MLGTTILEERKSKFNGNLKVVRSFGLGIYIQADGLTQSGGIVETFWKQTLNKIKKEKVESVLILGLGGGTVAKLARKCWHEAKITGVDIDPLMVELGKKYLGLKTADLKIKIGDANKFVNERYDLVIVDLYNGDEFPAKFGSVDFLRTLAKNKLVIFNRLYYKGKKIEAEEFGEKLKKVFGKVQTYRPISNLMFICSISR